ncbi:YopJ family acetyltransferase [Ralstonia pseudosolanacearum]
MRISDHGGVDTSYSGTAESGSIAAPSDCPPRPRSAPQESGLLTYSRRRRRASVESAAIGPDIRAPQRPRTDSGAATSTGPGADPGGLTIRKSIERFVNELKLQLLLNKEPEPTNTLHLNALVASEQVRKPWLNLCLLSGSDPLTALAEALCNMKVPSPGDQWQAVIDGGFHRSAVSVRHGAEDASKVSAIFIEPRATRFIDRPDEKKLTDLLAGSGYSVRIAYMAADIQRGGGCTFFALSAAKYMRKSPTIDRMHQVLLAAAMVPQDTAPVRAKFVDSHYLEPHFFKHATSKKRVNRYLEGKPPQFASVPVNKKGQTLGARQDAHMTMRMGVSDETDWEPRLRTYSTSIERKRVYLYEKAVATLGERLDRPAAGNDALVRGRGEIVELDAMNLMLLAHGRSQADVIRHLEHHRDIGIDARRVVGEHGESALHVMCLMLKEADWSAPQTLTDTETLVSSFIRFGMDVNARDARRQTPLFDALHSGALAQLLVRSGADVNAVNDAGLTPLRVGLRAFDLGAEIFPALIEAGAVVDEAGRNDVIGRVGPDRSGAVPEAGADAASWIRFFAAEAVRLRWRMADTMDAVPAR